MSDNMPKRPMGPSDLMLSPIGLGTWQFSKRKNLAGKYWPYLDDATSYQIIAASYNNGINWYDTAELYGNGESERTLARGLKKAGAGDEDVEVATKWNPIFRRAASISKTIGQRKQALEGYTISLHQIHNPLSFSGIAAEMKAMARLVQEQKIRYVGVSNFSSRQMRQAHKELSKYGIDLVSNQVHYNLLNRKIEFNGILDAARELNMAIIAYSPLAQGLLTGKYHESTDSIKSQKGFRKRMGSFREKNLERTRPLVDKLSETAARHQVTPAQVALNWLVSFHGSVIFAIPGASSASQAESNARAMQFKLSDQEMHEIDQESRKLHSGN